MHKPWAINRATAFPNPRGRLHGIPLRLIADAGTYQETTLG